MIRSWLLPTPRPAPADPWTLRGQNPGRLESFSDCTFSFALTLLIFATEVPKTFDELLKTLPGFVGFAFSFAILAIFWRRHVLYFQRYALADRQTVILNTALMAVVLFYLYPLKFLISSTVSMAGRGLGKLAGISPDLLPPKSFHPAQLPQMMALYLVGFSAMAAVFGLMFRHALRRRQDLHLSDFELLATRDEYLLWTVSAATAAIAASWCVLTGPLLAPYGALAMLMIPRLRRTQARRQRAFLAKAPPA